MARRMAPTASLDPVSPSYNVQMILRIMLILTIVITRIMTIFSDNGSKSNNHNNDNNNAVNHRNSSANQNLHCITLLPSLLACKVMQDTYHQRNHGPWAMLAWMHKNY